MLRYIEINGGFEGLIGSLIRSASACLAGFLGRIILLFACEYESLDAHLECTFVHPFGDDIEMRALRT
jgi:hypothetical protein